MDGFDDLLAPTRDALEKNPFADPFGRSSSPDPWTSFQTSSSALPGTETSAFDGDRSTTPTLDSPAPAGASSAGFHSYSSSEDPLESVHANATHESEPETPTEPTDVASPRSPGFRESISTSVEQIIEHSPPKRELTPPRASSPPVPSVTFSAVSPTLTSPTESPVSPAAAGHTPQPSISSSPFASLRPRASVDQESFSPLERPTSSTVERSFASLALGGESVNGWQSPQSSTFIGATSQPPAEEEDDEDDKPILQTRSGMNYQASSVPSSPPVNKTRTSAGIAPVFSITVDDPQRVGDPIRGYTMYTVHTKTTSPLFSKSAFSVLRRYSDFLWLYETLSANNPGVVVPPVPEKSPFNRFDASFVQQRRLALEKCIQKIANHPVLQKDADLKLFMESDTFALDIKHRKAEIAHEKGGLMSTIGQTITGPRFYETDEWFDKQKTYLDSLELQLRGLVKSIDLVSKQRSELAVAAGEFAHTIAELSSSDVGLGPQLSSALSGLAAVERKVQELQEKQSEEDTFSIMSTADEYARLISSVRLAFSSRVRTYHSWQTADSNVKRVKQTHETNRAQGKIPSDQLSRSLALVADAERRALDAKQEFDHVSRLVKTEVARFEQERIEDFKISLEAFLDGMMSKQKELITTWEAYQQNLLKRMPPANQRHSVDSSVDSD